MELREIMQGVVNIPTTSYPFCQPTVATLQPVLNASTANWNIWEKMPVPQANNKKDKTMCRNQYAAPAEVNIDLNIEREDSQSGVKEFLHHDLRTAYGEKLDEIRKATGFMDDERPKTVKEFIERIKAGKYQIRKNWTEDDEVYDPIDVLRWRDPEVKEDKEGLKTATEKLNKAKTDTRRKIEVLDPKEGLDALNAFEETTFH